MSFVVFDLGSGTEEILSFREEACCAGTAKYSEGPVGDHYCRVAEGPRIVEKLDQVLVCSQAGTAAALQESQNEGI